MRRQAASSVTPPACFAASVSPTARAVCSACFGISSSVTTVYGGTRTYSNVEFTSVNATSILTPTVTSTSTVTITATTLTTASVTSSVVATTTAIATRNTTSTIVATSAFPIPTSMFYLYYQSAGSTVYGRAQNLSRGVAISFSPNSADFCRFDSSRHLRDVTQSDDVTSRPPPGIANVLFLSNTTTTTESTPVCYVCGGNTTTTTIGCDYPDASGNVTDPGVNVWANCGSYLSLGLASEFANPPLGITCTIISQLFIFLIGGPTANQL
ncbi:hypothetical protein LTR53_017584 [Teratosphaeriaceae sp. CCFEE 6253]|nr:hypothetical protein LTR53_017584 [Teratosphaeriaceae sp. CCFEE 6253]